MRILTSNNGELGSCKSPFLGLMAVSYVGIDYLRHISETWHQRLQPLLWSILALIAVSRIPYYKHFKAEFRAALPFIASMLFMLACLLFEALSVRFVTAVVGLDWHSSAHPLPDTGQWLLLSLNENIPQTLVFILRARIVGLHHYLMLFMMLAFSVLFGAVEAPGLGLGARYMFTMAIGRLLRTITFVSTILPSARPWCASSRFDVPSHPHHWAQKYHLSYAANANLIHQVITQDMPIHSSTNIAIEHRPNWGAMSFLVDFLRPIKGGGSWVTLLRTSGGGCNDLIYSGHMLVAALTAMAWTEAYGGFSSAMIWVLVLHSAQREIRERHHYSVDCVVALYVGVLLWKMSGFMWPSRRVKKIEYLKGKLVQAAKDGDIERVRRLLEDEEGDHNSSQSFSEWLFACSVVFVGLLVVLLAFIFTSDG